MTAEAPRGAGCAWQGFHEGSQSRPQDLDGLANGLLVIIINRWDLLGLGLSVLLGGLLVLNGNLLGGPQIGPGYVADAIALHVNRAAFGD